MVHEVVEEGVSTYIDTVQMVIYKPFLNGTITVQNVPYILTATQELGAQKMTEPYISHSVLWQLSRIFKHMEAHELVEMDYWEYVAENQQDFLKTVKSSENTPIQEVIVETFQTDKEWADYVLKDWVSKYHTIKMQVCSNQAGKIVDQRSERAKAWLDLFHETLSALPKLQQDIIQKKYLKVDYDGKYTSDVFIYDELHISKNTYYRRKTEALSSLGKALIRHKIHF